MSQNTLNYSGNNYGRTSMSLDVNYPYNSFYVQLYNHMYNCAICIVYCMPICRLTRILWIFQFVQPNLQITSNIIIYGTRFWKGTLSCKIILIKHFLKLLITHHFTVSFLITHHFTINEIQYLRSLIIALHWIPNAIDFLYKMVSNTIKSFD